MIMPISRLSAFHQPAIAVADTGARGARAWIRAVRVGAQNGAQPLEFHGVSEPCWQLPWLSSSPP